MTQDLCYFETTFIHDDPSGDVAEQGDRIALLHLNLQADPRVETVDIVTEGAGNMHVLLSVRCDAHSAPGSDAEDIFRTAFDAADLQLSTEPANENGMADTVRQFAMA